MNNPISSAISEHKWTPLLWTVCLVVIVAPFVVYAAPQLVGADQAFVVLSGSMSPAIHAGDVVIVDDVQTSQIDEGDVITFDRPGGDYRPVTHRVVEVVHEDGRILFRTKGDANEQPDARLVPASAVIGVVVFHIPLIGYVIHFGNSDVGVLLLVVIPSMLLIANEILSLYRATGTDVETETDEAERR